MKKIFLVLICCLPAFVTVAQFKKRNNKKKSPTTYNLKAKEDEKFLQKQWWLGLKGGVNFTKPIITTRYSVLSPTNYEQEAINKKYENFSETGAQAALEITFYFKRFSLTLQPTYQYSQFIYSNEYLWSDAENPQNTLQLNYAQSQKINHIVIPLLARFDLTTTKLRPYVEAGGFMALLVNADKSIVISGTDLASGGTNNFTNEPIIVGAKDLFAKSYWGLAGGAGLNYHQGNIRINLDILYQHGLTNATAPANRYSNDRLVGVGDAMDDLTLDNIVISLGCLFPLRFLENGFKSLDKK